MAISPKEVLAPSQEELKLLAEVELKIDQRLRKEYRPGGLVGFPIMKRWRPGFVQALIDLYQKQGWEVTIHDGDRNEEEASLLFSYAPEGSVPVEA